MGGERQVETSTRRRIYEVLERENPRDPVARAVHAGLVLLILANSAAAVMETVPSFDAAYRTPLHLFEAMSFGVFLTEYALRLWVAPFDPRYRGLSHGEARMRYAVTPFAIVDLLSVLPFGLALFVHADLRTLALLRLIRFLKLARYSPGLASLGEALFAERHALLACVGIIGVVVLFSASLMYLVEGDVQPDRFGSIPLAAWWAVVSVTTVGYGDAVPATLAGRMIAALTMVTGMILLALPVGIVASSFAAVIRRRDFVVTWGMVERVPLFCELDAAAIGEILKLLSAHTSYPGELLARRGEEARSMFFILSGEVRIELPGEPLFLGEGHFFGEMALLSQSRRSANVRATRRTQLLILDARDLDDLLARRPAMRARMDELARKREVPHALRPTGDIATEEIGGEGSGTPFHPPSGPPPAGPA